MIIDVQIGMVVLYKISWVCTGNSALAIIAFVVWIQGRKYDYTLILMC